MKQRDRLRNLDITQSMCDLSKSSYRERLECGARRRGSWSAAQASQRRAKEVREEGKGEGKHLYKRFGGMTSN